MANQGFVAINRISEFIKQLSKGEIEISDATIASISLECAQKLENINRELQHDVKNTDVLHFDETCVKLNGKLVTIQGYANSKTTYLMAANTKCNQTLYAFLSDYHN